MPTTEDRTGAALSDALAVAALPTLSSMLDELKARKDLLDFATLPPLLDVGTVAALCDCSPRHIYRMSDGDRMPRPLKLGSLVRWRKRTGDPSTGIEDWIAAGCPSTRKGSR